MAESKKEEYQPIVEDITRMTRLANCLLDMVIEDQKLPPEEQKFHIADTAKNGDNKNSPIIDEAILQI